MFDPASVAEVVTMQPELFGAHGREPALVEPGLVQAARDFVASPQHTGRTATRDEQRCVAAFAMLSAGVSRREIGRRLEMGRHTLAAIEQAFETGGKLAPLKDRVQRSLALLVAEATEETRETIGHGVRNTESAAWLKAVATALGIGYDKHALATGGPTEIIRQVGPAPREQVAAWFAQVVDTEVIDGSSPDSDSVAGTLQRNGLLNSAPGLATDCAAEIPADPASTADPDTARTAGQAAAEGGGGDALALPGVVSSDDSSQFPNL